jgi:hypothetical protein
MRRQIYNYSICRCVAIQYAKIVIAFWNVQQRQLITLTAITDL